MQIKHLNSTFPYIIIDELYDNQELSLIWEELLFLCYPYKIKRSSSDRGGAVLDGKLLKNNNSIYLDDFYQNREYSNILRVNRKIFKHFSEIFFNHDSWFYKNISFSLDNTQISYYEDNDNYESHQDRSMVTCLTWFYKEPKMFEGGNLFFPNYNLEIEVLNNRMIIFPSHIFHSVDMVKMDKSNQNKKYGRFCISQFLQNLMMVKTTN